MGRVVSPIASLGLASKLELLVAVGLILALSGCGGSSSTQTGPPASYSIGAAALSPSSINAGNSASSTITITPANGYLGKVTLSCSSITGGGTPSPACSFAPNPATIAGPSAGTTTLTVATSATTPAATYSIQLKAADANGMAPSNASPSLQLVTIPPAAYSVTATALSPSSINTGNSATSTITVVPANGYTGNVTFSCSSITGGGAPNPACAFSPNPLAITGASSGTTNLTVSTNFGTPAATYTVQVSAAGAGGLAPSNGTQSLQLSTAQSIQHVVVIFQENRSPDNLFQDPVLIANGADIASSGVNSKGATIQLTSIDLGTTTSNPDLYDLDHSHLAFTKMCDFDSATGTCKMDGADLIAVYCAGATNCPPANPQFKYVNPADVQPYFAMAEQYTFGDRMFQTNQGPSFPAHQFLISGTSAPSPGSDLFAADNPVKSKTDNTGCIAPPTQTVTVIDPNGVETTMYPCFDHQTLTDLLNAAGISWRYYANSAGTIWTAPNAIQHMCVPNAPPPNGTSCTGSDWTNNVVLKYTQVLTDIANSQLAQVSWVTPNGLQSDHAQSTDGSGPSWVASVVNAIGNSPYWSNTVIFLTWDDWGGWYDHVPPKIISSYEYGFRVPLIVISPYAKPHNISHDTHDFGSMLKFIEENFGLPSLGYADVAADDFADCFNFSQTPLTFQTINAPLNAAFFLNDTRPPTDPDDD